MLGRKWISILAAWVAVILMASPSLAGQISPRAKWWRAPQIVRQLNLNNHEIQQLDQLHFQMQQRVVRHRNEIEQAKLALDNLMNHRPLNEQAVRQQYDRLGRAQTAIAQEKSQFLVQVRKILGRDRFQQLRMIFDRSHRRH